MCRGSSCAGLLFIRGGGGGGGGGAPASKVLLSGILTELGLSDDGGSGDDCGSCNEGLLAALTGGGGGGDGGGGSKVPLFLAFARSCCSGGGGTGAGPQDSLDPKGGGGGGGQGGPGVLHIGVDGVLAGWTLLVAPPVKASTGSPKMVCVRTRELSEGNIGEYCKVSKAAWCGRVAASGIPTICHYIACSNLQDQDKGTSWFATLSSLTACESQQ